MFDANQNFNERRIFIRMKIDAPVEVLIKKESASITGICRDLSGGGMLVELEETVPYETELEATLISMHDKHPMLKAKAIVARTEPNERGTYTIGLQILEMLT